MFVKRVGALYIFCYNDFFIITKSYKCLQKVEKRTGNLFDLHGEIE